MNTVILKNKDSDDIQKLESNLDNIHKSNFELETIVLTFLSGINDEKIDDDFHDIYKILINNKINNWLKLIDDGTEKSVKQMLDGLKVCPLENVPKNLTKIKHKKNRPAKYIAGRSDFPPSSRLRTKKGISKISYLFHQHKLLCGYTSCSFRFYKVHTTGYIRSIPC